VPIVPGLLQTVLQAVFSIQCIHGEIFYQFNSPYKDPRNKDATSTSISYRPRPKV